MTSAIANRTLHNTCGLKISEITDLFSPSTFQEVVKFCLGGGIVASQGGNHIPPIGRISAGGIWRRNHYRGGGGWFCDGCRRVRRTQYQKITSRGSRRSAAGFRGGSPTKKCGSKLDRGSWGQQGSEPPGVAPDRYLCLWVSCEMLMSPWEIQRHRTTIPFGHHVANIKKI